MSQPDIRSLDVGMLRTLDALVRERSVSRAAARLFLSQPAVSASLNRLREVFGDPLFTRTAHGMEPTPRALALAPQVEKLLADLAALLEGQGTFDPAASDRVFRLAGSDHASLRVLPALMRTLTACGSAVRIVWEAAGTSPVGERLHKGELDLVVVARIHPPRDMQTELLYEDDYVFVTRAGHAQVGRPLTLESFCATPQVFLGYGTSALEDIIDETMAREGKRRPAQVAVSSFGQIVDLLERSDHAAVIARRVAQAHAGRLVMHELPFALPRYQALVGWSARGAGDAGVQWLRAQVARAARAEGGAR
jgi:DNA-binding transcriptional LysR family regulator